MARSATTASTSTRSKDVYKRQALALCRSMEGCTVQLELKSTMDNDPAFVSGVVDAIRAAEDVYKRQTRWIRPCCNKRWMPRWKLPPITGLSLIHI